MPVSFYPSSHRLPNDAGQLITADTFSSLSPLYGLVALTENFLKPGLSFPFKGKKNSMTVSIVISGGIAYQDQLGNAAKVYAGQSLLTYNQEEALQWFLNLSDKISVSFVQLQFHAPSSPFPPPPAACAGRPGRGCPRGALWPRSRPRSRRPAPHLQSGAWRHS